MLKTRLLTASALVAAAALAAPGVATAQTTPPPASTTPQVTPVEGAEVTDATGAQDNGTVTVTGSRIRRPNLESTVPITSITGETFFQQGQTNVGDTLNDLPQLRSTFAQQNPGAGIGIAGLNLLDLRGLGTSRTLVLVNGRRHVPADILNNASSPDINTIPNDLIERVDIVTGGNSAIYGSDAIAGVVNFVLKRNFDGIQVRGQAGVAQEGFGGNQFVSALVGRNTSDGKGNLTVHAEYARTERVFASDVPAFRRNDNYATVDADGGTGIVNGGDGFPDTQFFTDIRSTTIDFRGLVPINQRNIANAGLCGNATVANNGAPTTAGQAFNCNYIFNNDGRLVAQTGTRFGTSITGTVVGGNGQTGREGNTVSVLPFTERYNFNILGHYEFSPALEVFAEAKWNRVNALGNNAGPSFIQTGNVADFRERPRLDNPFLNTADRTTLANLILASGCNTDLVTVCPAAGNLTAAQQAQVTAGTYRFLLARNLTDVGLRDEKFQRDTYRVVGGIRGTFNDDWSYELSGNYGKFKERITTDGFIDRQRFSLAMDAGRNPITGAIQCRSQFDPASAVQSQRADGATPADVARIQAANAARLAADIAACVPYNPFGQANNRASVAYFARTFSNKSGLDQLVLSGFVSGDSSQLFELPGGPARFALGAEYRRERAFYTQDPFVVAGFTNGVTIGTFKTDPFKVKEAFGELQLPIIADKPFFHELTLSGAGRVADYKGNTGTVWSYNGGVDYAPVRDIRFRANYGRAVRAPNVSETAFPQIPNFATLSDPCDPGRRGTGIRLANCTADLGPLLANLSDVTYSLGVISGSNPNLDAEKSDSYTAGVVIQPRWVPGLSLSIDYFKIKVKDIITSLSAQTIVNSCYDSASLDNVFCRSFTRNRGATNGPNSEIPGRILFNSLLQAPLNFASRQRNGIDVNFAYRKTLGPVAFDTSVIYTHQLKNSNFQDPTNPQFETRLLQQLGDPKDEFRADFNFGIGPVTLGYRAHYIGPQDITAFTNLFSINGLTPQNIDAFPVERFRSVTYHDLRADFDVAKDANGRALKFYVGVDNALNHGVPRGATTATGAGSAIYSFRGRNFYSGFRANF